jgi:hypothetical protein
VRKNSGRFERPGKKGRVQYRTRNVVNGNRHRRHFSHGWVRQRGNESGKALRSVKEGSRNQQLSDCEEIRTVVFTIHTMALEYRPDITQILIPRGSCAPKEPRPC